MQQRVELSIQPSDYDSSSWRSLADKVPSDDKYVRGRISALVREIETFQTRYTEYKKLCGWNVRQELGKVTWLQGIRRMLGAGEGVCRHITFSLGVGVGAAGAAGLAAAIAFDTYLAARDVHEQWEEDGTLSAMLGHVAEWFALALASSAGAAYLAAKVVAEGRYLEGRKAVLLWKKEIESKRGELSAQLSDLLTCKQEVTSLLRTKYSQYQEEVPKPLCELQGNEVIQQIERAYRRFMKEAGRQLCGLAGRCWLPKPGFHEGHVNPDHSWERAYQEYSFLQVLKKGYQRLREEYGITFVIVGGTVVPILLCGTSLLSGVGAVLAHREAEVERRLTGRYESIQGHREEWITNMVQLFCWALNIPVVAYYFGVEQVKLEVMDCHRND